MDVIQTAPWQLNAYAYEDIAVNAGIAQLTAANIKPTDALSKSEGSASRAKVVIIQVEGNSIRYRLDGLGNPVSGGPGFLAVAGAILTLTGLNTISAFRATQESAAATLRVAYYR